jgi:hypothetical protein
MLASRTGCFTVGDSSIGTASQDAGRAVEPVWAISRRENSLTECRSGAIQNLPFRVYITIALKNVKTTSDNTGTFVSRNTPRQMPVLSDVIVTFTFLA